MVDTLPLVDEEEYPLKCEGCGAERYKPSWAEGTKHYDYKHERTCTTHHTCENERCYACEAKQNADQIAYEALKAQYVNLESRFKVECNASDELIKLGKELQAQLASSREDTARETAIKIRMELGTYKIKEAGKMAYVFFTDIESTLTKYLKTRGTSM